MSGEELGPLEVHEVVIGPNLYFKITRGGWPVAELHADRNDIYYVAVKRAYAALIAAAPELLEAAREAAKAFRRYEALREAKGTVEGAQKAGANAHRAKQLEAAISKALGKDEQ